MAQEIASIKMSNGMNLPLVGFGSFIRTKEVKDRADLFNALNTAIESGYRHIDTAQLYANEDVIGEFLHEKLPTFGLKRSDIFITTKLWITDFEPEVAEKTILSQLKLLKTDYIDLYLLHGPTPVKAKAVGQEDLEFISTPIIDTWQVLEKYSKMGVLKAIGLSNFNQEQIEDLYAKSEIKPMNLQVECHACFQQKDLFDYCTKKNITFTSYATIGSPTRSLFNPSTDWNTTAPGPLDLPLVKNLAEKYSKTPAQILLRQMIQRGIAIIPKSVTPSRIKENIDIFDFQLNEEEMKMFEDVKENTRFFPWKYVSGHPMHPFEKH